MHKKLFSICISLALVLSLSFTTVSCVKKATTETTPTVTVQQLQSRIVTLESNVASQTKQITSLQNQTPANYQPSIDLLNTDLATLRTQINNVDTSSIPKYVMITDLGRKYIEVETYGAGDYSVVVTLYGEGLKTGQVDTDDDDIVDEYLYGEYSLTPSSNILDVSNETFDVSGNTTFDVSSDTFSVSDDTFDVSSGTFEVDQLTEYTVTVSELVVDVEGLEVPVDGLTVDIEGLGISVSGLTVEGIAYDLTFTGTMLVVIVEPDKEWATSDTFELDIRDISGDIYYATANVSIGE